MKEQRSILIVDDEKHFQEWLSRQLKHESLSQFDFSFVDDGFQLASVLAKQIPDLIFLDIMIPGADGYAICRVIKNNLRTATIPVVLMSGKVGDTLRDHFREVGAADYLVKPFSLREFRNVLFTHLPDCGVVDDGIDEKDFEQFNPEMMKLQLDEVVKQDAVIEIDKTDDILSMANIEALFEELDPITLSQLNEFSTYGTRMNFKVRVDEDRMAAVVVLKPPKFASDIPSDHDVVKHLQSLGICYGIDRKSIISGLKKLANQVESIEVVAAKGKTAVHGFDTHLELCSGEKQGRYQEKNDGSIDFKERHDFIEVVRDELIGNLIDYFVGEDGIDVYGNRVKANSGVSKKLRFGSGVMVSATKQVYSKDDGFLILTADFVDVKSCFVVEGDVGIETGNINFSGMIQVNGSIRRGYSVTCGESLTVKNSIESAEVKCMGNVIVKGGIIGSDTPARVICQGELIAKYVEKSWIEAAGGVTVFDSILNSTIYSGKKVAAITGKGRIVGGKTCAQSEISCIDAGSITESKTKLIVGIDYKIQIEMDLIEKKLKLLSTKMKIINSIMNSMKNKGINSEILHLMQQNPNIRDFIRNHIVIRNEFTQLSKRRIEILQQINIQPKCQIVCQGSIFQNVKMNLYGLDKVYYEQKENQVVRLEAGQKIVVVPFQ